MDRTLKPSRIGFLLLIIAALAAVYIFVLYDLSVIEAKEYLATGAGSVATVETVKAARGPILDRNGNILVSDEKVYNVKISRSTLLAQDDPNYIITRLIADARAAGIEYNDSFPVTATAPFEFIALPTDTQRTRLEKYLDYPYFRLSQDISAPDLMAWLREHYKISFTATAEEARAIIGVRYELELRAIMSTTDYIFAEDVNTDFITMIKEERLPAVSIETGYRRTYHTAYAAQLLGTMGYITQEYYDAHKDEGYTINSIVGRSGVEAAFEEYLRGHDGTITTYRNLNGDIIDVEINEQAVSGNALYLTIDTSLQEVAERSLANTIAAMNASREAEAQAAAEESGNYVAPEKAEGGAVVVIDVRNGDVITSASYPTYDPANYRRDIAALNNDRLRPLWNRATQGPYEPGSTFKMVTALAGLTSGTIDPDTVIHDDSIYMEYAENFYTPKCWIYPYSHGDLNVVGALENSCNYFFYWVADHMGINAIVRTATQFGLGSPTGIEIGEASGILASREWKQENLDEGWYAADTLQAAIGQNYNVFTPIQIANYVATIANGGTHYKNTILKYLTTGDYSSVLLDEDPVVLNVIDDSNGYLGLLQQGMRRVVTSGTAASSFRHFPISVAAKTGTVQSDNTTMNTGVFVLYAPATDPEIAIAVVVEKGGSGSALTQIAKDIVLEYFTDTTEITTVPVEGALAR